MNLILALIYQGRILGEDHAISLGQPEEAAASFERSFSAADSFVHRDPNDQMARGRLATAVLVWPTSCGIQTPGAPWRSTITPFTIWAKSGTIRAFAGLKQAR
jgi:hypothetical protein